MANSDSPHVAANGKAPTHVATLIDSFEAGRPPRAERMAFGKSIRRLMPRTSLGSYQPLPNRPSPLETLAASNRGRLENLIPVRFARMAPSPFTFLRGSAAATAFDVGQSPNTGIRTQLCGDCHLLNFGGYGTPERNFLFDISDFDETIPGPFEWDVKRLVSSIHVSGRCLRITESGCKDAVTAAARSYRRHMTEFAMMSALDVWYSKVDEQNLLGFAPDAAARKRYESGLAKSKARSSLKLFPKITENVDGRVRIKDAPPLVFHIENRGEFDARIRDFFNQYRMTLQDDRRELLDRFSVADVAAKVVGVGSVGTRCAIVLLLAANDDPLFLQFKEARPSVWEPYAGMNRYRNEGQRVVAGQRLMQSASDIFLGWATGETGEHFYFRQLRDMKVTIELDGVTTAQLTHLSELCGWALARAHAKAGDAAIISGYLGKGDAFDRAMTAFAKAYADQTEQDYAVFVEAIRNGTLEAHVEVKSHS